MVPPFRPVDVYVRVSRVGKRGERLISPDEQERRARELARDQGLIVGRVLPADLDESGGKLDRPGLQEALRRIENGESGGIIVAWLDRLSRDSEHALGLVRRITEAGGRIYAPDAPADWTTPEGELQAGIFFMFAQYTRSRARAGFERSKEQAVARGIPVNTRAAVGYLKGADRRLEPDPVTAPVVREMFDRRAQGEGPAALGQFLESRAVATSQGSRTWSKQAVYGMLRNPVYLGQVRYGSDDRYVNPSSHAPIVDVATWTAAQHPGVRRVSRPRSADSAWLLTGILRCAACGYATQGTTTSRAKRIYRCTRTHAGGVCPAPARIDADTVEAAAVDAFWSVTADLAARGTPDTQGDLTGLEAALRAAERTLAQWMSPEVQEAIGDMGEYAAGLRERRASRDQAADALGHARAQSVTADALPSIETLRGAWERMTIVQRRELLGLRFDCVALRREPREIIVYPAGTGPADLPRRGFKRTPELVPFPDAQAGRVLALR